MKAKNLNPNDFYDKINSIESATKVEIYDWGKHFLPLKKDTFEINFDVREDSHYYGDAYFPSVNIKNEIFALVTPSNGEPFEFLIGKITANSIHGIYGSIEEHEARDFLKVVSPEVLKIIKEETRPYIEALNNVNKGKENEMSNTELNYYSLILNSINEEESLVLKEIAKAQEQVVLDNIDREKEMIEDIKSEIAADNSLNRKGIADKVGAFAKAITVNPFINLLKKVDNSLYELENKNKPKKKTQQPKTNINNI